MTLEFEGATSSPASEDKKIGDITTPNIGHLTMLTGVHPLFAFRIYTADVLSPRSCVFLLRRVIEPASRFCGLVGDVRTARRESPSFSALSSVDAHFSWHFTPVKEGSDIVSRQASKSDGRMISQTTG
jgi:hypothetical protein